MTSSVAPRLYAVRHKLEQIARLGGGVDRRANFAGDMVLDGADEDGFAGGGVEERLDEEGRCRLAIGSGDAGGRQLALGMAEEGCGGLGQGAAAVFDLEDGQAGLEDEQVVELMRGVGDDAESAGGDGLFHVAIAISGAALHGDEDGAGLDATGVVFDATDGAGGVAGCTDGRDFSDEFFPIHVRGDCRLLWGVERVTKGREVESEP